MGVGACRRGSAGPRSKPISETLSRGRSRSCRTDEAAATWHGAERARLEALGRPAPFVDGQIAAIAKVHGLVLATTNDKDFARFKGLTVENWSK